MKRAGWSRRGCVMSAEEGEARPLTGEERAPMRVVAEEGPGVRRSGMRRWRLRGWRLGLRSSVLPREEAAGERESARVPMAREPLEGEEVEELRLRGVAEGRSEVPAQMTVVEVVVPAHSKEEAAVPVRQEAVEGPRRVLRAFVIPAKGAVSCRWAGAASYRPAKDGRGCPGRRRREVSTKTCPAVLGPRMTFHPLTLDPKDRTNWSLLLCRRRRLSSSAWACRLRKDRQAGEHRIPCHRRLLTIPCRSGRCCS